MRKIVRFFAALLILCIFLSGAAEVIPKAYAASEMTASEACIDFIKRMEGFSAKPYFDYQQHTVGYGTKCPTDKYFDYMVNGIPKSEAEELLREAITGLEDTIHEKLIQKYNLSFTQHQFDALLSFSFNVGTGWMNYDSSLRNAILNQSNPDELVYAFSLYSTAGGNYLAALINRRLCEADMYLNGVYNPKASSAYGYVFYEPNGGSLTYRVQGFLSENHFAPAADAVRTGDVFLGWYTDLTGGTKVQELDRTLSGKTLFARWKSSESKENQDSTSALIHVTGDVVNIRKGPGTNYGIAKQVYQNDELILSHVTNLLNRNWGKVQDGWICLEYTNYEDLLNGTKKPETEDSRQPPAETTAPTEPSEPSETTPAPAPEKQEIVSGTVRVNDLLRIRSGPGTLYPIVGYLFNDQKVEIQERKTVDSMVWGRMNRGWISMNYIVPDTTATENPAQPDTEGTIQPNPENTVPPVTTPEQDTQPEQETLPPSVPAEPTEIRGKIKADALRIRSGIGTFHSIVGYYYQNEVVVISQTVQTDSANWGRTDKGWINMDYVSTDAPAEDTATPSEGTVKTVIADCLRVRKQIGTDSRIAALLYYGDTVTVYETKTVDDMLWGRVDHGWICMDYVQ